MLFLTSYKHKLAFNSYGTDVPKTLIFIVLCSVLIEGTGMAERNFWTIHFANSCNRRLLWEKHRKDC